MSLPPRFRWASNGHVAASVVVIRTVSAVRSNNLAKHPSMPAPASLQCPPRAVNIRLPRGWGGVRNQMLILKILISTRTFTSTGTCAQAALHSPPADARGTTTRNRSKTSSAWRPQNGRKGRPQNGSKGRYICPSFRFVAAHFLPCAFCMGRFIRQEICARRRLPWVATRARHRREAWFCQTSGMECPGYPVWVRATQGRVTVPLMNQCATKQRRRIYER